eukprot:COSAG04_NODE_4206_length_2234_cov_25.062295_3_plen_243_part_00
MESMRSVPGKEGKKAGGAGKKPGAARKKSGPAGKKPGPAGKKPGAAGKPMPSPVRTYIADSGAEPKSPEPKSAEPDGQPADAQLPEADGKLLRGTGKPTSEEHPVAPPDGAEAGFGAQPSALAVVEAEQVVDAGAGTFEVAASVHDDLHPPVEQAVQEAGEQWTAQDEPGAGPVVVDADEGALAEGPWTRAVYSGRTPPQGAMADVTDQIFLQDLRLDRPDVDPNLQPEPEPAARALVEVSA